MSGPSTDPGASGERAGDGGDGDDGGTVAAILPSYEPARPRWRPPLTDAAVLATVVAAVTGARSASVLVAAAVGVGLGVAVRASDVDSARWMVVVVVAIGAVSGARAASEHDRLTDHELGRFEGRATVVGDPRVRGGDREERVVARVVLRIDGRRYESWLRGDLAAVVGEWRGGDQVHVRGERLL
ncbi:MAG: hypothetical protein WD225_05105, partial [Ilumatobacteraceae bacterium]